MKKMENSIETSGSKLKGVRQFLTDKSIEIKDVIMSNTNQQDITSKLKSLSNYQIKTPDYLNGFVKSTSAFSVKLNNSQSNMSFNGLTNGDRIKRSDTSLDKTNIDFTNSLDLDSLPVDESFKPLSLNWWGINKSLDYLEGTLNESSEMLIDIQISSCNL